jgi:hypothetical protein
MKGVLPLGWFIELVVPVQEIFVFELAGVVGPVQNIFSPPYTISIHLSLAPCKLGRQSCWVSYLLVCVWSLPSLPLYLKSRARSVEQWWYASQA